ncbi:hypothetical protein DMB42_14815 [Nonomuraea sp. WAC 01424]|uniref:hypothetical protein n=1 Tax=Nonomuraea sp. WAC 01424 TaxID=2203200 RepID=UPI000F7761DB|nr:hypothetical protein [Nonomuraea sp. WAC 01424]RSN11818.1 hypothetical protein DMB42_14815 [Nonomuraea sp. WAC 01424]
MTYVDIDPPLSHPTDPGPRPTPADPQPSPGTPEPATPRWTIYPVDAAAVALPAITGMRAGELESLMVGRVEHTAATG